MGPGHPREQVEVVFPPNVSEGASALVLPVTRAIARGDASSLVKIPVPLKNGVGVLEAFFHFFLGSCRAVNNGSHKSTFSIRSIFSSLALFVFLNLPENTARSSQSCTFH